MTTALPTSIATYMQATNIRDTDLLLTTLTSDAMITDEGQDYHGLDEIRAWKSKSNAQGQFTVEALAVAERGDETVVTTLVSGTFPGSPVQLHFHFILKGDKIAAASIRA